MHNSGCLSLRKRSVRANLGFLLLFTQDSYWRCIVQGNPHDKVSLTNQFLRAATSENPMVVEGLNGSG